MDKENYITSDGDRPPSYLHPSDISSYSYLSFAAFTVLLIGVFVYKLINHTNDLSDDTFSEALLRQNLRNIADELNDIQPLLLKMQQSVSVEALTRNTSSYLVAVEDLILHTKTFIKLFDEEDTNSEANGSLMWLILQAVEENHGLYTLCTNNLSKLENGVIRKSLMQLIERNLSDIARLKKVMAHFDVLSYDQLKTLQITHE